MVQDQYQKSINRQIKDRLTVHVRELESLFTSERANLESFLARTIQDKSLIYFLSTMNPEGLKSSLSEKIIIHDQKEVKVYTQGGQTFVFFKGKYQNVHDEVDLPAELMKTKRPPIGFYSNQALTMKIF